MAGLLLLLGVASAGAETPADAPPSPTVVELFQSQGCSSCPPANANLNAIADRPDVLALSFSVTYWDQLGWRDTFAKRAFTDRQYAYARGLGRGNVATPQVVINGRVDITGIQKAAFEAAVRGAGRPLGPPVTLGAGQVAIAAGTAPARPADVWLVRYDPRVQNVPVRSGENRGRTLPHRNIVREMSRLGAWRGAAASFAVPAARDPAWRTAILVQAPGGGPILAAAKG